MGFIYSDEGLAIIAAIITTWIFILINQIKKTRNNPLMTGKIV